MLALLASTLYAGPNTEHEAKSLNIGPQLHERGVYSGFDFWTVTEASFQHACRIPVTLAAANALDSSSDVFLLFIGQLDIYGCGVFFKVLDPLGSWNWYEVYLSQRSDSMSHVQRLTIALFQDPRQCQLSRSTAFLLGDLRESIYQLQVVAKVFL